jgi:Tfp pilus assembly protein PilO
MMNKLFGSLIILSPTSMNVVKFRFTPTAILILVLSCLLSFGLVVAIGYVFPPLVSNVDHLRLERENQELRVSNQNAAIGAAKLAATTDRMEEQTKRILDYIKSE